MSGHPFPKHPGGGIDTPAANAHRVHAYIHACANAMASAHALMASLRVVRMCADEVNADPRAGDLTLSQLIEQTEALVKTGFGDLEE